MASEGADVSWDPENAEQMAMNYLLETPGGGEIQEASLSGFLDAGLISPATAQVFFGDSVTLPSSASATVDKEKEASFLTSIKTNLESKRKDLMETVKAEKGAPKDGGCQATSVDHVFDVYTKVDEAQPGSGERQLTFDPEEMMVEELREECKLRSLPTSGPKAVVIKRLREAIAKRPELPADRLTHEEKKRKRAMNKREPERDEFDNEEDYQTAWQRWRDTRDHNNESVKRSRENARMKKQKHVQMCKEREKENAELTNEVQKLREQVQFLTKVLAQPEKLDKKEQQLVSALMSAFDE